MHIRKAVLSQGGMLKPCKAAQIRYRDTAESNWRGDAECVHGVHSDDFDGFARRAGRAQKLEPARRPCASGSYR